VDDQSMDDPNTRDDLYCRIRNDRKALNPHRVLAAKSQKYSGDQSTGDLNTKDDQHHQKKVDDHQKKVDDHQKKVDDHQKKVDDHQKIYRNFDPMSQICDRVPSTSPL
jgi:uncharacterized protein YlxW (UPF0749 family)